MYETIVLRLESVLNVFLFLETQNNIYCNKTKGQAINNLKRY